MKIQIDNRDLAYTIDTYGVFTGESSHDYGAEYIAEQYDLAEDEWRNLGFDYDHPAIVRDLAEHSIAILWDEFAGIGSDGIVKDIKLIRSNSPRFYNYTTDFYVAEWTFNAIKLKQWIGRHSEEFKKFIDEAWSSESEVYEANSETRFVAMIDYYTQSTYDPDKYLDDLLEKEMEVYSNHMVLDEESQKLIDSKESADARSL